LHAFLSADEQVELRGIIDVADLDSLSGEFASKIIVPKIVKGLVEKNDAKNNSNCGDGQAAEEVFVFHHLANKVEKNGHAM
jgi:hypothetical protein